MRRQLEACGREVNAPKNFYESKGMLSAVVDARQPIEHITGEILDLGHPEGPEFYS